MHSPKLNDLIFYGSAGRLRGGCRRFLENCDEVSALRSRQGYRFHLALGRNENFQDSRDATVRLWDPAIRFSSSFRPFSFLWGTLPHTPRHGFPPYRHYRSLIRALPQSLWQDKHFRQFRSLLTCKMYNEAVVARQGVRHAARPISLVPE